MKSTKEGWNFSFQVGLWPHWHPPYGVVDEILSISCAGDKHFSSEQRQEWELKKWGMGCATLALQIHHLFFPTRLCLQRNWHTWIAPCICWLPGFWLHSASEISQEGDCKKIIQLKYIFLWNPPAKLPCRLVVYFYPKPPLMQTALVHIILLPRTGNCSQSWSLMGFQLLLALGQHTTSLQAP